MLLQIAIVSVMVVTGAYAGLCVGQLAAHYVMKLALGPAMGEVVYD